VSPSTTRVAWSSPTPANRRLQFFDGEGKFQEEWRVFGWEEFYTRALPCAVAGKQS